MAIATTSIAVGKIAATKIAARKTKELVVKEVKKRAKKEIVKRTVGKVADASESENLAKIAKPVAKELSELKSGKLNPKELPAMKTDVFKNGPKDIQFDLNKDPQGLEYRIFDESKFLSGTDKVVGRKPTPDSLLLDTIRKEALFVRDVRPSECASGSWFMPLDNDRMREFRDAMAHEFEEHTLTREDAEARIIVREHDLKMDCRPERWRNPDGVPADFQEKLLIRIPSDQTDRIDALLKTLTESGRSPEVIESRGVTSIKYNIEKPTWESQEVGFVGDLEDVFLKGFVNSEGLTKHIPREGGEWTGVEGYSIWKPDRNEIPKKCNSEGTTWGEILDDNGVEGIEFKDGEPDFSPVSKGTVQIDGFSTNRDRVTAVGEDGKRYTVDEGNYHRADCALAEQWNAEARDGRTDWTYEDVEDYRQENKLTWHECGDQKTMMLVDSQLHANVPHSGGISAAKNA